MMTRESLQFEIEGRIKTEDFGKRHISVRWEPAPGIARVGVMLDEFTWDRRMQVLESLLAFERDHSHELAVEFDIIPLEAVNDETFAEA